MLIFFLLSLFCLSFSQTNVTWQAFDSMYSGILQPITSSAVSIGSLSTSNTSTITYKYKVTFVNKTFSSATLVNIGIISIQMKPTVGSAIFLINDHDNRTTTGFTYYLTVNTTNLINTLKINYLCVDDDLSPGLGLARIDPTASFMSDFVVTSKGSGYREVVSEIQSETTINTNHVNIDISHIKAFCLAATSSDNIMTLGIKEVIVDSETTKVTIWTSGYTRLYYFEYYTLFIDLNEVEITQQYFMDYGTIYGSANTQLTQISTLELVSSGYIFMTNFIKFNLSSGLNQGFNLETATKTLTPQQDYSYVNMSYFSFKVRACPTSDPNYYDPTELCYDTCPTQTYVNATYKFCTNCSSACSTCTNGSSCTSCNTTESFRVTNGTTCSCMSGYYDTGAYICSQCIVGCAQCSSNSTCTTCNTTAGYSKSNSTCVCNSTSFSNSGACANCSSVLLGCSSCNDSSTCNTCLNSNYTYVNSSTSCECSTGYIEVNSLCISCSEQIDGCIECSSTTSCTKCDSSFDLINGTCYCPDGSYLDSTTITCQNCDMSCLTCTNKTASSCSTCASFLVQGNGTCSCPQQGDVSNGTACVSCSNLCSTLLCTGSASSSCQSCGCACQNGYYLEANTSNCATCNTSNLASSASSCTCPLGMYPDSSNSNNSCLSCSYSCFTCTGGTENNCTLCNNTDLRTLTGSSCPCNAFYMDANNSTPLCIPLVCNAGYSITSSGYCAPICGDGLVAPEQKCDDKNSNNGDGCSSTCQTQTNWTCSGNLTTSSVCFYNQPLQIELVSIIKDPASNNLTYTINISPNISSLADLNFSQIVNLGLPNDTKLQYTYQNGVLTVQAQYFQNLQSIPTNITINPSNSQSPAFSQTPPSSLDYKVEPTNNLAANVYSDDEYGQRNILTYAVYGLMALSFLTYCLGLYSGKLIGTEMIWVVQLGFIGLIMLDFTDPLYQPMRNLMFVNGYSIKFSDVQTKMPYRIENLGYYNSLINNLNVMIAIEVVVALLSLSFFIASKVVKDDALKTRLSSYSKLTIGEYMITAVLLMVYQYSVSVCILVQYPYEKGMILYASMAEAGVFGACAIVVSVFYGLRNKEMFGEYKTFFKSTKSGQYYYFIPIISRIVIGAALGMFNGSSLGGFVAIGALLVQLLLTAILRPYLKKRHTLRQLFNLLVGIIILGCYIVIGKMKLVGPPFSQYIPIIVVALLICTVLLNLTFLILQFIQNCKTKKKLDEENEKKHQEEQIKIDQANQLAFFEQQAAKNIKAAKKSRRVISVFKSKSTTAPTLNAELLKDESMHQPIPKTTKMQFENSLYPMDESEAINLDDIKLHAIDPSNEQKLEEIAEQKEDLNLSKQLDSSKGLLREEDIVQLSKNIQSSE